ncbi:hypothetical protein [Bradyrhizobium sp.]|uniref:hypothetical protein n=1 Tax=Bradyrhizobium sp. TaxID=376 RepID=UPI003C3D1782
MYSSSDLPTDADAIVGRFAVSSALNVGLDIEPQRAETSAPHTPSARVWILALHSDAKTRSIDDLLTRDARWVSARTGESLIPPEDDILFYEPQEKKFVYATTRSRGHMSWSVDRAARTVFAGEAESLARELLFISFRGGAPAARTGLGAPPISRVVDQVAHPRDRAETAFLCSKGLSIFKQLDGSVEGIMCRAIADSLLEEGSDPFEVISYLNRSQLAFGRSWLSAPCKSAHQARRLIKYLATQQSQHKLPFDSNALEPKTLQDRRSPTRLGFSSEHAAGLAITTHAEAVRDECRLLDRRVVLDRIPFEPSRVIKLFERVQHEKLRPSALVLGKKAVAGQVVDVEAVLDGELPTMLGIAGRVGRADRWTTLQLSGSNASIENPVIGGYVGEPVVFRVTPSRPGRVGLKLSCLPERGTLSEIELSFPVS